MKKQASMMSFMSPPDAKKKRKLPDSVTRAVPLSQQIQSNSGTYFHARPSSNNGSSFGGNKQYSSKFNSGTRNGGSENKKNDTKFDDLDNDYYSKKFVEELTLSGTQKQVLDLVMSRKSVFFTGAAGTGKSYILRILQDVMEKLKKSDKISFTASTGVAACNIRGLTIHSWAGIGRATDSRDSIVAQVTRNSYAKARWKETEILVIDEISMLSGELLDLLSFIGSRVRNDSRPFGGMQVILCGDFFQLPPIGIGKSVSFCFQSATWQEVFKRENQVVLDTVFRQKDDAVFLNILNDMRRGLVSDRAKQVLLEKVREFNEMRARNPTGAGEVGRTKLFSTNKDVDAFNTQEMLKLARSQEDVQTYRSIDEGVEPYLQQLKAGTKAPELLELRIGAQVMLLKNKSTGEGLVNGARGTVIGFEKSQKRSEYYAVLPVVRFDVVLGSEVSEVTTCLSEETWETKLGVKIVASRIQLPLMLAWAISIHKSQGMTIPLLEVSFNNIFEYGQGYVALSRATCLRGLTLVNFAPQSIKAHKLVADFYRHLESTKGPAGTAQTVSTTLTAFAQAFVVELPEAPEEENDGWIETKRALSSSISSAAASLAHQKQTHGSGAMKQESNSAAQYPSGDAGTTATGTGSGVVNNNVFAPYRYDEWLEGPVAAPNPYLMHPSEVQKQHQPRSVAHHIVVKSEGSSTILNNGNYSANDQGQASGAHIKSEQQRQQSEIVPSSSSFQQTGRSSLPPKAPVTLGAFLGGGSGAGSSVNHEGKVFNSRYGYTSSSGSYNSKSSGNNTSGGGSSYSEFNSHNSHNNHNNHQQSNYPQDNHSFATHSRHTSVSSSNSGSGLNNSVINNHSGSVIHDLTQPFDPYAASTAGNIGHSSSSSMNDSGRYLAQQSSCNNHTHNNNIHNNTVTAEQSQQHQQPHYSGEVKMGDLTDDLKRRIEANRLQALQKARESKLRRELELQKTMQEHNL